MSQGTRWIHHVRKLSAASIPASLIEKGQNRVIDASLTLIRERAKLKGELLRALGGAKASASLLGVPLGHNSSFLQGPAFAPPRIREAIWCGSTNSSTEEGKEMDDPRVLADVGDVPIQEIRDCGVDDDRLMNIVRLLLKLIDKISTEGQRVVLVGYSMGARIALHMALNSDKIKGAVIISGSPGLKQESNRKIRQAIDKSRAKLLISHGLHNFIETWYSTKLWSSLREHPHFDRVLQSRTQHDHVESLAKVLHDSSVAKQRSLWDDLKDCKKPLVFIAGEKDSKFVNISYQMHTEIMTHSKDEMERLCEVFIVPNCGHAVHFENPLQLIHEIKSFLAKLN